MHHQTLILSLLLQILLLDNYASSCLHESPAVLPFWYLYLRMQNSNRYHLIGYTRTRPTPCLTVIFIDNHIFFVVYYPHVLLLHQYQLYWHVELSFVLTVLLIIRLSLLSLKTGTNSSILLSIQSSNSSGSSPLSSPLLLAQLERSSSIF